MAYVDILLSAMSTFTIASLTGERWIGVFFAIVMAISCYGLFTKLEWDAEVNRNVFVRCALYSKKIIYIFRAVLALNLERES